MTPGVASVCPGEVFHRRVVPREHRFRYAASYVWLDPDRPDDLCRHHPLWSARRPALARFRRRDYGGAAEGSLGDGVRDELEVVLGRRPSGAIRMLTQIRRWGWLFNPITVYLAWDRDPDRPVGAVLEVTNTPWKQRHRYAVTLTVDPLDGDRLGGRVAKTLHVSPFLDESYEYAIGLREHPGGGLTLTIDVLPPGDDRPTLTTALCVERVPADRVSLRRAITRNVWSTHRVSLGIHAQALRLWLGRVPFVPHPSKRADDRIGRLPAPHHRHRSTSA